MTMPPPKSAQELEQLDRLLRQLVGKVPGYPYELALAARLSGMLEKRMAEAINDILKPLQLTSVLYHAMMIMHGSEKGVIAPKEISELTGERPNNVTHICNHLEKSGYITRTHAPTDRRRVEISLTPAGRRILSKAQPLVWATWRNRFKDFSQAELASLPQLVKRQIANLDSIDGDDG